MKTIEKDKVIYGIHPVEELIKHRINDIENIYFDNSTAKSELFELLKLCRSQRLPYQLIPRKNLDKISGTTKNQGIAAVCSYERYLDNDELFSFLETLSTPGLLLLPASVEDPGNLGAIIRSAVAFGVDAILLERKNTTSLNSTVAKTSAGMIEQMKFCKPRNLEKTIAELIRYGYKIVGAEADAAISIRQADFSTPLLVITGNEHKGIPSYLRKLCDEYIQIPIQNKVESLNVSAATSIILYEIHSQRTAK
ncbi:MAG: 23S rRNA (guanosine(2251)-2'-O)-methyltransferase RlmB [Candidatus Cloacimonetes bacterium]|nr:23S rRNA (guanosine(2251)-2'-O)-methyltransferase RlmB [Candidatus Cloacimonadota bacterium]